MVVTSLTIFMFMPAQAAKILANLIVMGSGILIRAFAQAYRQALASESLSKPKAWYFCAISLTMFSLTDEINKKTEFTLN